jgi:cytochrome c oxidase subunit IV
MSDRERNQVDDARLVRMWVALAALMLAQVAIAVAGLSRPLTFALLLGLSVLEAEIVLFWFMHLKFERRGLALSLLPIAVATILLLTAILPDSVRSRRLAAPSAVSKEAADAKP